MVIRVETVGRRHYLRGDTFAIKDRIRAAGCKWDPEAKAWYSGDKAKVESVVALLADSSSAPSSDHQSAIVAGKATYKGRSYYLAGRVVRGRTRWDDRVEVVAGRDRDGDKYLLLFRDGSQSFWATRDSLQQVTRYNQPKTIGGLKKFFERLERGGVKTCGSCGSPSCDGAHGGHCDED